MKWFPATRRALRIDDAALSRLHDAQPWLVALTAGQRARLCELIAEFLTNRTISGAHGLIVDDTMRVAIAAQACLPVLNLGLAAYGRFSEVIVHPTAFTVRRTLTDDIGLVTEFDDVLAGEVIDGGPVVLSWDDIVDAPPTAAGNVVIHEFVHKLDLADGLDDGCPPMPAAQRRHWLASLERAFEHFNALLDDVEASIPADIDPDSEAADPWFDTLPLDPYAATDPAEFFAVAAEAYFVSPARFTEAFPEMHDCFVTYFQQKAPPVGPHRSRPPFG
jgi:Mlc titration factor MtfA (ptsG expression regulator)